MARAESDLARLAAISTVAASFRLLAGQCIFTHPIKCYHLAQSTWPVAVGTSSIRLQERRFFFTMPFPNPAFSCVIL